MKSFFLFTLLACVSFVAFLVLPFESPKATSSVKPREDAFENYDIRTDSGADASARLRELRGEPRRALAELLSSVDGRFKIEPNQLLGSAEVIGTHDLDQRLALPSGRSRQQMLRDFLVSNRELFGPASLDQLRTTADYTNPDGNLSYVTMEQFIDGVPVFGAEIKAGFDRANAMFRVVNDLAPAVDAKTVSRDFGSTESAIRRAASHIGIDLNTAAVVPRTGPRPHILEFTSDAIADPITAERFYFPVGNGVVLPSWRVLLESPRSAYYVVVAVDGTLLWRKNLVLNQTAPAVYEVYGNLLSPLRTADSPSPFTPGCSSPVCPQPPGTPRMSFTLVGNEGVYSFNNLGWIPDTGLPVRPIPNPNITDGNNVEAGIDRDGTNGIDDNGWATGSPSRTFDYTYNPAPGDPPPGEEPLPGMQTYPPSQFQQGAITHGFYIINRWHDEMYRFGFTEQARNFQHFNFGRGGSEGDRVSLEIQDSSGTSGSNIAVTADGGRPRLQTFIWTVPTPDRDGALDSQNVLHEMTHGISTRLVGNASGLTSNMARGMGEGWSDFYPLALLSLPADNPLGTYAIGSYSVYQVAGFDSNYYYGFRRFPYAVWASRGPNGLPHNPLTFRYINAGCDALIGTTVSNPNSAYPRNPVFSTSGSTQPCDQVHNLGEVWATALWEVRDQLIQRYGSIEGNRRVLQYVTDGMKLSPLNPTLLQMRDAILSAAAASDSADVAPIRRGFAIRGMGVSATILNPGTGSNNTVVTEAFDIPSSARRPARADFDGDARSDLSVFRPSDRVWYMNRSTTGFAAVMWGVATDDLVPDDYDGDGKTDIAVFRVSTSEATPDYYILRSTDSTIQYVWWGINGDLAVSEDFDGDGKGDQVIYRPSTAQFWMRRSSDGSALSTMAIPLGGVPLAGDFDGDGRGDVATFTDGSWWILRSETGYTPGFLIHWGIAGDRVVTADYDGDGKDDLAVYRPSTGTWYVSQSSGGTRVQAFGISTDIPAPADYDGDGRADIAVYRNGIWYVDGSTSGVVISSFGLAGDLPLPTAYLP